MSPPRGASSSRTSGEAAPPTSSTRDDRGHRRARGRGEELGRARARDALGFRYLDTGAMYRALTWLALHEGAALTTRPRSLEALAVAHPVAFDAGGRVQIAARTSPRRSASRRSTPRCRSLLATPRCAR